MERRYDLLNFRFVFVLILIIFLSSFSSLVAKEVKPLTFGIHNYDNEDEIRKIATPLAKYIATILQVPVKLVITKDYQELIRRFISGEFVFAVLPPYAYVKTKKIYKLKHLANLKMNNKKYYRGAIVVNRDAEIEDLSDLKDSVFGFVSRDSASGYLYPLVHMAKMDLPPPEKFFKETKFLESHNNVIEALVSKKINGGAIFENEILQYYKKGGDISNIQVVARTPHIPFDAFVAQANIPSKLAKAITSALIKYQLYKFRDKDSEKLAAWTDPDDSIYNSVRDTVNFLRDVREKKEKVLRFGMFPRVNVKDSLLGLKPFINYLSKETGYKIQIKLSPNYLDVGRRLLIGDTDFSIISPFAYVQTVDRTILKPVILGQQSLYKRSTYQSVILGKGEINSLEKLKGKTFAFVDPDSSSGRLIPMAYFKKHKIEIKTYFDKVYYAGNHDKTLEDLVKGKTDGCACAKFIYDTYVKENPEKGKEIKLIHCSGGLPRESIIARKDLNPELIKALRKALMKINTLPQKEKDEIFAAIKYDAIVPAVDSVYDIIREIIPYVMADKRR